jgi:hypothetical protein
LQRLHRALRLDLLDEDREQNRADGNDEENGGQDPVPVRAEPVTDTDEVPERMPLQQNPGDPCIDPSHGAI